MTPNSTHFRKKVFAGSRVLPGTLWVLVGLIASANATAQDGHDSRVNGRWRWHFTMPDGSRVSPVARLRYDGKTVTGTSRFRHGTEVAITNGRLQGETVSFEVVRLINEQRVITRYSGTFRDDKLFGTIESDWQGKPQTYPWEALRLPETLEGTWKWSNEVKDRRLDFSVKLRLEGEKVHGKLSARKGAGTELKEGRYKEGIVSFEVERERDGEKFTSKFVGKLVGDTIKGKETVITDVGEQTLEWIAMRND